MEEDGSMPQDGAPLGQAPQHDPTADPAIGRTDKVLSIEDAKAVTMTMLSPWSQDHLQNREIQRLWPDVDSNLPRGALVSPSGALQQSRGDLGARKRQRTEQQQPPTTAAAAATTTTNTAPLAEPSFALLEDGTLQKPSIPGVSPETTEQAIKEILKDMRKTCGVCRPCRARAAGQHSPETHCPTLKAVKAWDNEFGGVSYAVAEEMARKLAQPLMHGKTSVWKNRKRSGDGIRCEACASCRRDLVRRYKCKFLIALQEKTLPERFRDVVNAAEVAVMESLPAPVRASVAAASAAANQVTLEQYIDQYMPTGVHTNRTTTTTNTAAAAVAIEPGNPTQPAVEVDGDGEIEEEGDELEDEENMRWSGWAPFLSHPQALQYTTTTSTSTAADSTRMNTKQQVAFIAQRLGVNKESLIDWICTAKVHEGECGHVNSRHLFHCESCTTPRWSGPVGQLSTRIISALQSGIWIGTAGRSTIEVESDLASTVAARIAAEAGPGAEELPEIDELMEKVHDEIQRVGTAREVPVGTAVARGGSFQKEEQLKSKIGGIARRTKMGKAVSQLQTAVGRLVEEQVTLRKFKLAKEEQEKTGKKGDGVVGTYQRKMDELVQLRSLLIESKEHPFHWDVGVDLTGAAATTTPAAATAAGPSTSKRQRSGISAASGLERPSFVGYSAFYRRITNALSRHNTSVAVTLAAGYQSLCDMLFISAPPLSSSTTSSTPSLLSSQGWTEVMVAYLEILLKDVEATKQLMLASQIGGPANVFRHVFWALLQRQQRKQREETAAAAAEGGTGNRVVRCETPSQPSQRPNPFLIPTQQSQPDTSFLPLSRSQPQSQAATAPTTTVAAAATAAAAPNFADAAFDTSIALLDDLINAIDPSSTIATTATIGLVEEEEERQDQHRMNVARHMTSTTLQIVYDLTHSVLNSVALKEAIERMPVHLTPFLKTILQQAQFPDFPPLPPPPPLSPLTTIKLTAERATTRAMNPNRFDLHDVVKPIPDSRHRVQDMVKGVLPRKGRPPRVKATDREMQLLPSQGRSGAFSAFKPVESVAGGSSTAITPAGRSRGEVERAEEQQSQQQEVVNVEVMKQCPADVQLVFSEAINSGVRPEVVYKAAMRYLATVEMGK